MRRPMSDIEGKANMPLPIVEWPLLMNALSANVAKAT
jgi:hypothetical protein